MSHNPNQSEQNSTYETLCSTISELLTQGRDKAARQINSVLVQTSWQIGKYIVEFEQNGKDRATYGTGLMRILSKDLTASLGKGFSLSNLKNIRNFYLTFSKSQTLSDLLSWSHYVEILKIDDALERTFYIKQCEHENWSIRELKRQMKSMLFHRLALSKNKQEVLKLAKEGLQINNSKDIIKDPYVFEFLGIPEQATYKEGDLEERLIHNLEKFLSELGKGFAFIARQYKISIAGRHFYVDLVFIIVSLNALC